MTVSIIIPNFNHVAYLQQRIESVLNQTYQDFEVILMDDCSTDGSCEILESYRSHPKVSEVVFNTTNSGSPFKQWLKGAGLAKGDFIWIAESDDYAADTFLESLLDVLKRNKKVALAYSDSELIDDQGSMLNTYSLRKNKYFKCEKWSSDYLASGISEIMDYMLYKNIVNNMSAVVFRKHILKHVDFEFLQSLRNTGDFYFYLAAMLAGDVYYISLPLNKLRKHGNNLTVANSKNGLVDAEVFQSMIKVLPSLMHDENKVALRKAFLNYFAIHHFKQVNMGYGELLLNGAKEIYDLAIISKSEFGRIKLADFLFRHHLPLSRIVIMKLLGVSKWRVR